MIWNANNLRSMNYTGKEIRQFKVPAACPNSKTYYIQEKGKSL